MSRKSSTYLQIFDLDAIILAPFHAKGGHSLFGPDGMQRRIKDVFRTRGTHRQPDGIDAQKDGVACHLQGAAADRQDNAGGDLRETRYRLKDNDSVFYLKYVEPVKDAIDKSSFLFGSLDSLDGWDSLMGIAFKNLVLSNLRSLRRTDFSTP